MELWNSSWPISLTHYNISIYCYTQLIKIIVIYSLILYLGLFVFKTFLFGKLNTWLKLHCFCFVICPNKKKVPKRIMLIYIAIKIIIRQMLRNTADLNYRTAYKLDIYLYSVRIQHSYQRERHVSRTTTSHWTSYLLFSPSVLYIDSTSSTTTRDNQELPILMSILARYTGSFYMCWDKFWKLNSSKIRTFWRHYYIIKRLWVKTLVAACTIIQEK